jgi:hypothetical protein
MNRSQAAALRQKWSERVHPLPCDHPNQELEHSAGGYLTGIYHCVACGETVPHPVIHQD